MALAALITPPDVLDFGKPRGDLIGGGGVGNRLIRQQSRDFRDHVVTMRARCDRAGDGASDRSVDDMYVVTRSKQRSQQVDSLLPNVRDCKKNPDCTWAQSDLKFQYQHQTSTLTQNSAALIAVLWKVDR